MKILNITSRSISLELDNNNPYYNNEYDIFVNDNFYKKDNRNVTIYF